MEPMTQLNYFFAKAEARELPASAQLVYLHLFNKCNRLYWPEWFMCANSTLQNLTKLKSNNSIIDAKNRLKQESLIDFKSINKKTTCYHIIPITAQDDAQDSAQVTAHGSAHCTAQVTAQDGAQLKRLDKKDKTNDLYDLDGFSEFWTAYPRKEKKQEAAKSYKKLKADKEMQGVILRAVEAFKRTEQWQKDGGQYIPHAVTWLNQRRWEDETTVDTSSDFGDLPDVSEEEYAEFARQQGISLDSI